MDLFFPLKEGEIGRKEEYFFHTEVNGQLILMWQGQETEAFTWNSVVAGSLPSPSSPGAALLNLPLHFLWAKLILCNAAIGSVAAESISRSSLPANLPPALASWSSRGKEWQTERDEKNEITRPLLLRASCQRTTQRNWRDGAEKDHKRK